MAYNYYQSTYPGWGTSQLNSQFQFGSPPLPMYQPNPSWNGIDYYNASAINPDPSLYYSIISRIREFAATGGGVGLHDARKWHRLIYGGQVNLRQTLPADIGSAAAYEAYRNWRHHHSVLFNPLGGSVERERDALVGMAVAEASHLWQYSGRPFDAYGLQDAYQSAALTASRIAARVMEDDRDRYMVGDANGYADSGRSGAFYGGRDRRDSYYGGSDRSSPDYYPSDRERHRLRRHSSSLVNTQPPIIVGANPSYAQLSPYGAAMPIPGAVNSGYYPNSYAGSYNGAYPVNNGLTVPGYPVSYGGGYPGSYPGNGMVMPGSISNPYLPGGASPNLLGTAMYPAPSYGGTQYLSAAGYTAPDGSTVYPAQATGGTTIIIPARHQKSSSHRHRSHSRHSSR